MMKQVAALGVPMSQPLDFGICDNGKSVYSLLTWCDGEDVEIDLPRLTETEQYVLGIKSGEILKKMHSIPAPKELEEWSTHFNRKTNYRLERYKACSIKFDGDNKIIDYIENNRYLLSGRPQCFHHGDYHVGNMIISPDNELSIIDFNRWDFGDPWEEFNRIVWSALSVRILQLVRSGVILVVNLQLNSSSCWPFTFPATPSRQFTGPYPLEMKKLLR